MRTLTRISAVTTVILGVLFLSVLFRDEPKLQTPLLDMNIASEPKHNEVIMKDLPSITGELKNITKGAYILKGEAYVPVNATVTIEDGTYIYAERDSRIVIQGQLTANNVTWLSNQAHPSRKYWYGIVVEKGGRVFLSENTVSSATTGITAASNSQIRIDRSVFINNVVGLTTLTDSITTVTNSSFEQMNVGINAIGGSLIVNFCAMKDLNDGLRIFHPATPTISAISISNFRDSAITYRAEPNLHIPQLNIAGDFQKSIVDGSDQPTHEWQGKVFRTGTIE